MCTLPLLSICIPTYNRVDSLKNLLPFLEDELELVDPLKVEIIVSDNCSNDQTRDFVDDFIAKKARNKNFIFNENAENKGAEANFRILQKMARGKYVWIMGDDDIYYHGILQKVLIEIEKDEYSLILLNHCIYKEYKGDKSYVPSVFEGVDVNRCDKNVLLDLLGTKYGTCIMFISAAIHRNDIIHELETKGFKVNMAYSMLKCFYSASKGKTKIIKDIYIEDNIGTIGWTNKSTQVFEIDVPYVIRLLPLLSYDEKWKVAYKKYMINKRLPYTFCGLLYRMIMDPYWSMSSLLKNRHRFNNIISFI